MQRCMHPKVSVGVKINFVFDEIMLNGTHIALMDTYFSLKKMCNHSMHDHFCKDSAMHDRLSKQLVSDNTGSSK